MSAFHELCYGFKLEGSVSPLETNQIRCKAYNSRITTQGEKTKMSKKSIFFSAFATAALVAGSAWAGTLDDVR